MGWDTSSESYGSFLRRDTETWNNTFVNRLPTNVRNKKITDLTVNGPSTTCDYGFFARPTGVGRTTFYKPRTGMGEITYKVTERTLNKFNDRPRIKTPFKSVPTKMAVPVRPDLVKLAALKPLQQKAEPKPPPAVGDQGGISSVMQLALPSNMQRKQTLSQPAGNNSLASTTLSPPASSVATRDIQLPVHNPQLHGKPGQMALPEIKRVSVQLVTKDNRIIPLDNLEKTVHFANGTAACDCRDVRDFNLTVGLKDGTKYNVSKCTPHTR